MQIRQSSEYASGSNYGRVLNIPRSVQCSEYVSIWLNYVLRQSSEYTGSTFHEVLNKLPVLNMPGLRIWQDCKYVRVIKGAEFD